MYEFRAGEAVTLWLLYVAVRILLIFDLIVGILAPPVICTPTECKKSKVYEFGEAGADDDDDTGLIFADAVAETEATVGDVVVNTVETALACDIAVVDVISFDFVVKVVEAAVVAAAEFVFDVVVDVAVATVAKAVVIAVGAVAAAIDLQDIC